MSQRELIGLENGIPSTVAPFAIRTMSKRFTATQEGSLFLNWRGEFRRAQQKVRDDAKKREKFRIRCQKSGISLSLALFRVFGGLFFSGTPQWSVKKSSQMRGWLQHENS